jgi:hypothetical protein
VAPFSTRTFLFVEESVPEELAEPLAELEICIPLRVRPTVPVAAPVVCAAVFVTVPTVWVVELTRPPTVLPTPPRSPPPELPRETPPDVCDDPEVSAINESPAAVWAATLVIDTIDALNGADRSRP